MWEQGRISPVPASRKEVFEHAMKLGDKRALWRFLKGASEALEGRGSLQVLSRSLEISIGSSEVHDMAFIKGNVQLPA